MDETDQDSQDVVIPQCDEVRVFANARGWISIVQTNPYGDDNALIDFPPQYAGAICKAIRAAAKSSGR